ncbi:hypothetical protein BHM03_00061217 [Ensete ventricosum]|nr:hypothetical protein BHM03_00061217 [Ensete ventricosum]
MPVRCQNAPKKNFWPPSYPPFRVVSSSPTVSGFDSIQGAYAEQRKDDRIRDDRHLNAAAPPALASILFLSHDATSHRLLRLRLVPPLAAPFSFIFHLHCTRIGDSALPFASVLPANGIVESGGGQ